MVKARTSQLEVTVASMIFSPGALAADPYEALQALSDSDSEYLISV